MEFAIPLGSLPPPTKLMMPPHPFGGPAVLIQLGTLLTATSNLADAYKLLSQAAQFTNNGF
jgi:hypothetical protein